MAWRGVWTSVKPRASKYPKRQERGSMQLNSFICSKTLNRKTRLRANHYNIYNILTFRSPQLLWEFQTLLWMVFSWPQFWFWLVWRKGFILIIFTQIQQARSQTFNTAKWPTIETLAQIIQTRAIVFTKFAKLWMYSFENNMLLNFIPSDQDLWKIPHST